MVCDDLYVYSLKFLVVLVVVVVVFIELVLERQLGWWLLVAAVLVVVVGMIWSLLLLSFVVRSIYEYLGTGTGTRIGGADVDVG